MVHHAAPLDEERIERSRARVVFEQFFAQRHLLADGSVDPDYERLRGELAVLHLGFVRYLAAKFANRGEPLDDLIQVGTLGLLKSIDRFAPERGVEFTTFATPTIVGEIKRHFRDKGWALRVPRRLQELNLKVNRAIDVLALEVGRVPTVGEIADYLAVSNEDVLEAQELGGAYNPVSLDAELGPDDDGTYTLIEYVGERDPRLTLLEDRAHLERAFGVLSPRERVVLYLRYYEHLSQIEVAKRLGISQMHVSRLQQKALDKLRAALRES